MTLTPRFSRPLPRRLPWLLLALGLAGACSSSDDDAPAKPTVYDVQITAIDGADPDGEVPLRCDHRDGTALSTLAVSVRVTSSPENQFTLRPLHACGSSKRCGFVRVEALAEDDTSLAQADTATASGVLELSASELPQLTQLKVSLIRGLDGEPVVNPDETEVVAVVTPTFVLPAEPCVDEASGGAGQGGAGSGGAGLGGAGGDGTTSLGGAGGTPSEPGGGASGEAPVGGAGAGGAGGAG
jgi:hypothetical protein